MVTKILRKIISMFNRNILHLNLSLLRNSVGNSTQYINNFKLTFWSLFKKKKNEYLLLITKVTYN